MGAQTCVVRPRGNLGSIPWAVWWKIRWRRKSISMTGDNRIKGDQGATLACCSLLHRSWLTTVETYNSVSIIELFDNKCRSSAIFLTAYLKKSCHKSVSHCNSATTPTDKCNQRAAFGTKEGDATLNGGAGFHSCYYYIIYTCMKFQTSDSKACIGGWAMKQKERREGERKGEREKIPHPSHSPHTAHNPIMGLARSKRSLVGLCHNHPMERGRERLWPMLMKMGAVSGQFSLSLPLSLSFFPSLSLQTNTICWYRQHHLFRDCGVAKKPFSENQYTESKRFKHVKFAKVHSVLFSLLILNHNVPQSSFTSWTAILFPGKGGAKISENF